ncbi:MAG TPA: class I SAM-dependent methyltransferase [Thermoanaerobaculia bacterium]|nr:class I SAM-dependent methyltransferase [Thermoanaerobaculia bacterium]
MSRIASLYDRRDVRSYVRWKVRGDPAYAAILQRLPDEPLIDLGCGVGILPFFLREHGFRARVIGIDFDARKIEIAQRAATRYRDIDFVVADARRELPDHHNVVMLDLLHYLDDQTQRQVLANVARVANVVILRQGIRDSSWRYRMQAAVDGFARTIRWMRAETLNYPARESIVAAFDGFSSEITPLWGLFPYNNYLFVFRRAASSGMTSA